MNIFGEGGLVELPRASLIPNGHYSFGAWLNYFHHRGEDGFRASPVSFGLGMPANLEASFSFTAMQEADPSRRAQEVNLRVGLKYCYLTEPKAPFTLSSALRVENVFSLPDLTAFMLGDRYLGRGVGLSWALGYSFSTDRDHPDHLIVGFGGEYRVTRKISAQLEGQLDHFIVEGASGLNVRVAGRWDFYKHLGLVVGLSGGVGEANDLRVLVGLRYRPSDSGRADADGDGVPDKNDACPDDPEDRDGFRDTDGCPDPDNDGDGIPDKLDQTPNGLGDGGLHQGPVRMRMRIPQQPIPIQIMGVRKKTSVGRAK
ncbi:MAG: hypothetical protein JRH20_15380 [Deltaproteobacteria bacterium]|nr:hypothetical protein [Deltaproteobacteria bacterium]